MRTCIFEQPIRQSALAMVNVRDDAEIAYAVDREIGQGGGAGELARYLGL